MRLLVGLSIVQIMIMGLLQLEVYSIESELSLIRQGVNSDEEYKTQSIGHSATERCQAYSLLIIEDRIVTRLRDEVIRVAQLATSDRKVSEISEPQALAQADKVNALNNFISLAISDGSFSNQDWAHIETGLIDLNYDDRDTVLSEIVKNMSSLNVRGVQW